MNSFFFYALFRRIIYRGETYMRLKDLDLVEQAAKMVKDKFKIDFVITQCSREIKTTTVAVGVPIYLKSEPELKIELTVSKDHKYSSTDDLDVRWIAPDNEEYEPERMTLEYVVYDKDLKDGSLVDELIGGDLKKQAPDMRQVLRLAFILYDGIRYWTTGEQKKEYADKGWSSRLVSAQSQSYMTE